MPQFFVLGTSTLRGLVLAPPRNLAGLRRVEGMTQEKSERFGAEILQVCNSSSAASA